LQLLHAAATVRCHPQAAAVHAGASRHALLLLPLLLLLLLLLQSC
jgi:hypothetical protein